MNQLEIDSERWRTIFLSDLHLGSRHSRAERIVQLLSRCQPEAIFLVGDTFDNIRFAFDESSISQSGGLLGLLRGMQDRGTHVTVLPGNHDWQLSNQRSFNNWPIEPFAIHTTTRGHRWLIHHGDIFDRWSAMANPSHKPRYGAVLYPLLVESGRCLERFGIQPPRGYRHWCSYWKSRLAAVRDHINAFRDAMACLAEHHGCDGVVCGHIHQPDCQQFAGIKYVNCGDWVEHCSMAVETSDGEIQVIQLGSDRPTTLGARKRWQQSFTACVAKAAATRPVFKQ